MFEEICQLASGYQCDSRLVKQGDLFFALVGERVDGHTFLRDVAERGACAAVVHSGYAGESFGLTLFRVDNVLETLHQLAHFVHKRRPCIVVGVTGSVGKTTTKEFIVTVLEGKFRVGKTPGNANSQVGMPLSILNSRGDEEVFVMEMGMSQSGDLTRLVALAPPTIAVITAVELCHALYFPDGICGIARAKAEILSSPETQCAILHASLLSFPCMQREGVVSYGAPGADFELAHHVVMERGKGSPPLEIPFVETHLCSNVLAAIAVARALGMSWEEIQKRVPLLRPFPKRFERLEVQGRVVINDAYNASPASMRAALCNLPHPERGKKRVAVLGSMKELGSYTEGCHREVAVQALSVIDHLLCLGEECAPMVDVFKQEGRPVELFSDLASLKERVFAVAEKGDVLLIKGSNSHRLWQIID